MTSKVPPAEIYWTDDVKMTSKVQPAADYWTADRENLGKAWYWPCGWMFKCLGWPCPATFIFCFSRHKSWHFGLLALRNTFCGNACFGAQVSSKYGTWYSERVILPVMCVGSSVVLIRRSWVRFPPRSKDFFFTSCGSLIPFTRANAQWVIHGFN